MNHCWEHHKNYDDEILNHSLRILSLGPEMAHQELRQNPDLANKFGVEKIFIIETSEEESSEAETVFSEPRENVRMNNAPNPESPNFFKEEPDAESSQQGAERKKRKATREPMFMPTKPKTVHGNTIDPSILDIDYLNDWKKIIDKWVGEMGLIIQTNPDVYNTADKVRSLLEHKSTGNAEEFIKGTSWAARGIGEEALQEITTALYVVFLGLNYISDRQRELEKQKETAKSFLAKIQLCDICDIQNFNCAYEKNFYKLNQSDWAKYIELYLNKIPIIGEEALIAFKATATPPMHMSLGLVAKTLCSL